MRRLDRLLGDSVAQKEILRAARVWRALRRWEEIVGSGLFARSRPDRYEAGVVYVAVTGSAWAQELRMQSDRIRQKLAEMTREPGLVTDVRFGVRELPEWPSAPARKPEKKTVNSEESLREIAERILKRAEEP